MKNVIELSFTEVAHKIINSLYQEDKLTDKPVNVYLNWDESPDKATLRIEQEQ